MLLNELPADTLHLIVEQVYEDPACYIKTLKSLSLVNKQLAAHARPKLWEKLCLRSNYPSYEMALPENLQERYKHLFSNPFISASTDEIVVFDLLEDSLAMNRVQRGPTRQEAIDAANSRLEREMLQIIDVLKTVQAYGCTRLTLEHTSWFLLPGENPILDFIPKGFSLLTHLTLVKGPVVDLGHVSEISTLQSLELIDLTVTMAHPGTINNTVPKLKRLAMVTLRVERLASVEVPLSLALGEFFNILSLDSVAISVGDDSKGFLEHMASLPNQNLKELSIHLEQLDLYGMSLAAPLSSEALAEIDFLEAVCKWQILPRLLGLQQLYLYFSDEIQIYINSTLGNLEDFLPPPSITRLYFGATQCVWEDLDKSRDKDQIRTLLLAIASDYDKRWNQLRVIDLQLLTTWGSFRDESRDGEYGLGEASTAELISKGVSISISANKLMTKLEWPYYLYTPKQKGSVAMD